jgi:predicted aldo/keto reductase-like oxidoreductase
VQAPQVSFGRTGLVVGRLCFGTLQLALTDARPDETASLFEQALDLGINLFDTAKTYRTQAHVAALLSRAPRERVLVSTRANFKTREDMQAAFEESLQQLGTDYIDIYGIHGATDPADWAARAGAWEFVLERKAAGQIRATIVTTHSAAFVAYIASEPSVDAVMGIYNMTGFGLVNETLADAERGAQAVHSAGKAFIAMKPLAAGGFVGRVDEALRFYLDRPHCTCLAIGMQSLPEVMMNTCLISGQPVPEEVRRRVAGQRRRLVIREWCQGCGICSEICPQGAIQMVEMDTGRRPQVDDDLCMQCGYCSLQCPIMAAKII